MQWFKLYEDSPMVEIRLQNIMLSATRLGKGPAKLRGSLMSRIVYDPNLSLAMSSTAYYNHVSKQADATIGRRNILDRSRNH